MTKHVNKGAQKVLLIKLVMIRIPHMKKQKMERYHNAYQQKAKEE